MQNAWEALCLFVVVLADTLLCLYSHSFVTPSTSCYVFISAQSLFVALDLNVPSFAIALINGTVPTTFIGSCGESKESSCPQSLVFLQSRCAFIQIARHLHSYTATLPTILAYAVFPLHPFHFLQCSAIEAGLLKSVTRHFTHRYIKSTISSATAYLLAYSYLSLREVSIKQSHPHP